MKNNFGFRFSGKIASLVKLHCLLHPVY